MATFLSIFPELREVIYHIILTSPDPPPSPSVNRDNRTALNPSLRAQEIESFQGCTLYPSIPPKIASMALLLCNRQIHNEISATIAHLKLAKKLYYEIDCEIANEQTIYPTWLLIPVYFTSIPCIYVTFRLSGACVGRSSFHHGCGGPGKMIWSLLALLNRFLKRGPDFGFLAPSIASKPFQVEKLILNVTIPTLSAGETLQLPITQWPFRGGWEGEFVHPETVVNIMMEGFWEIFNERGHGIGYGKFIASRVASMSLKCDGEERHTWDLANMEHLK